MEQKPKVYFTKTLTPEKVVEMFKVLNFNLEGNVGVKIHSGEPGNKNFIRPEFMKPMVDYLKGTVIEANTAGFAGHGRRWNNELHKEVLEEHGWSKLFKSEILDEKGEIELKCEQGKQVKVNYVGEGIKNYDSILVLSHFKGHGFGGFGGALKQLSIGFASRGGKAYLHSAGQTKEPKECWGLTKKTENIEIKFKDAMADAAWTVANYYKGKIAYINVLVNISVDCDCAGDRAKPPCMKDIGIMSSLDPVAIDQACVDMIYKSDDPGKGELIERIEKTHGMRTIETSVELGTGKREYELVNID